MTGFLSLDSQQTVAAIAAENCMVPAHQCVPTADLRRDLRMDDSDIISFVVSLEHEFGFSATDEQIESLKTLEDAHKLATSATET